MVSANTARCPALTVAAAASGQGKTTLTGGIARHHRRQGRRVQVFKLGPDFLDPMILEQASGQPVRQLDSWMTGAQECRAQLTEAAKHNDLLLLESAMGLFDGNPSGADMAQMFNIPIALVLNAQAMAQTTAAIAHGLTTYRPDLRFAGLLINRLGSERHEDLIREALPEHPPILACVRRDGDLELPARHLGLLGPEEIPDIEARIEHAADRLAEQPIAQLPDPITFTRKAAPPPPRLLEGIRLGVARDAAFRFIYPANLELLETLGATLHFFSPLTATELPAVDALWLPGGYPELYLQKLADNRALHESIAEFHRRDRPILAECGGMLYLLDELRLKDGTAARLAGLLRGHAQMRERGGCQGLQTAPLPEGALRAHAHHRSRAELALAPIARGERPHHPAPGEAIYRQGRLTATYLHLYFPSNPAAVAQLLHPTP